MRKQYGASLQLSTQTSDMEASRVVRVWHVRCAAKDGHNRCSFSHRRWERGCFHGTRFYPSQWNWHLGSSTRRQAAHSTGMTPACRQTVEVVRGAAHHGHGATKLERWRQNGSKAAQSSLSGTLQRGIHGPALALLRAIGSSPHLLRKQAIHAEGSHEHAQRRLPCRRHCFIWVRAVPGVVILVQNVDNDGGCGEGAVGSNAGVHRSFKCRQLQDDVCSFEQVRGGDLEGVYAHSSAHQIQRPAARHQHTKVEKTLKQEPWRRVSDSAASQR